MWLWLHIEGCMIETIASPPGVLITLFFPFWRQLHMNCSPSFLKWPYMSWSKAPSKISYNTQIKYISHIKAFTSTCAKKLYFLNIISKRTYFFYFIYSFFKIKLFILYYISLKYQFYLFIFNCFYFFTCNNNHLPSFFIFEIHTKRIK